jgi:hypothetical protein
VTFNKGVFVKSKFLKSVMMLSATVVVGVMGLSSAHAQESLQLGQPIYGGNGCPQGSASATASPDGRDLSILFDQFQVEAGSNGKRIDRKSCNLAIPLHVPQGYSVSVFTVDYRGFTSLPYGARALFNAEYFFAGAQGPRVAKNFSGPQSQGYIFTNQLAAEALVWSPCGADTNLRVNSSMFVQTNRNLEDALATVDSADVKSAIVFHVQWWQCN